MELCNLSSNSFVGFILHIFSINNSTISQYIAIFCVGSSYVSKFISSYCYFSSSLSVSSLLSSELHSWVAFSVSITVSYSIISLLFVEHPLLCPHSYLHVFLFPFMYWYPRFYHLTYTLVFLSGYFRHLFSSLCFYRSVKAILCGCGTRIYLCRCHTQFLKNRVSHPVFFEFF